MRKRIMIGLIVLAALLGALTARSFQSPAIRAVDEATLREYAGVYQWDGNSFLYLQIWPELTGTNQLVAFDETGELRTLYPTEPDRFFTGPGAAVSASVESRIEVQRAGGKIASLTWSREGARRSMSTRPSRLHTADPAEGQSRPAGSGGWQQRGNEIAAASSPRTSR